MLQLQISHSLPLVYKKDFRITRPTGDYKHAKCFKRLKYWSENESQKDYSKIEAVESAVPAVSLGLTGLEVWSHIPSCEISKTNYAENHITELYQESAEAVQELQFKGLCKIWLHFLDQTADRQKTNFASEKKYFSMLK